MDGDDDEDKEEKKDDFFIIIIAKKKRYRVDNVVSLLLLPLLKIQCGQEENLYSPK